MARRLKRILALCNRRGFLLNNAANSPREYNYGPCGAELKRNLINEWWQSVVISTGNVHPVDSSVITDSPNDVENRAFLLSRTEACTAHSLRPNIYDISLLEKCIKIYGQQLPFGIAECGRVFTPPSVDGYPLRQQEAESMSVQFLCQPSEDKEWYYHWQKYRLRWWKRLAANPENFSLVETPTSELPEYTLQESFIKFNFPWGAAVVEHLSNKGDSQFQRMSEETQAHFKHNSILCDIAKHGSGKKCPHLLTISANVDRGLFAYLCDAYNETQRPYGADQELKQCVVLRLHSSLSPCKVTVLPTSEDHRLSTYCRMLTEELRAVGIASRLSTVGSFPYRLALEDEMGTPYHIIVDEKTLETGIVALQDRDTTAVEDMAGRDVLHSLQRMLSAARLSVHTHMLSR